MFGVFDSKEEIYFVQARTPEEVSGFLAVDLLSIMSSMRHRRQLLVIFALGIITTIPTIKADKVSDYISSYFFLSDAKSHEKILYIFQAQKNYKKSHQYFNLLHCFAFSYIPMMNLSFKHISLTGGIFKSIIWYYTFLNERLLRKIELNTNWREYASKKKSQNTRGPLFWTHNYC